MKSVRLRHLVTIQRQEGAQDSETGEMLVTWVDLLPKVWAEIAPQSAREFSAAAAEQSEISGRITIRYRADVDATMRVAHGGSVYQILGVLPDMKSGREYLTLPVSKGVRV